MNSEQRRSKRFTDFLPIFLNVTRGQQVISGPFPARIVNISHHGARLLMTRVMKESFHVFHSTREDDALSLQLVFTIAEQENEIAVHARPVWLDSTQMDDIKVFTMGIDFMGRIDDHTLRQLSKRMKNHEF